VGKYLAETKHHIQVVEPPLRPARPRPKASSPGRKAIHDITASLIAEMEKALGAGPNEAASSLAAECVRSRVETTSMGADPVKWQIRKASAARP